MAGPVREGQTETTAAHDRLEWELPAEPLSVTTLRTEVRRFAAERGAGPDALADLALAVTEAATNAVLHAFIGLQPGTIRVVAEAAEDEMVVTVTDDGRGMQPRPDSPGLGLGLPTIGRLTSRLDMREPPGGGTELSMVFSAPGLRGPRRAATRRSRLLEDVARTAQGAWPGEGVERLVDLVVPELADACAVDVVDAAGHPQRFAGRLHGPDAERRSRWLATLKPRTDAPHSATRAALEHGGSRVSELTPELIAAITADARDAAEMTATGIRWWVVIPLREHDRLIGLLHFGMLPQRGRPEPPLLGFLEEVGEHAARGLANTQLVAELRATRRRFERILDVLAEAVTVRDARGRTVYANEAAARLFGYTREAMLQTQPGELAARFEMTREDGTLVTVRDLPSAQLLAGRPGPPLLTRSRDLMTGEVRWLLTKATLLEDGETLAINIIEDVTASHHPR